MRAPGSDSVPVWAWPVLLVTALHLLTTSGGWWVTDHGEILAVADHFIATGRLDLADLGPEWADWNRIAQARGTTSTRFQPLSILVLAPLLVLDRIFGWRDPASFKFVHLQGHVFVTLGLILVGRAVARLTGGSSVTALAVLLAGLNWPVWMIARRLGPEPVLFALLAAFATGGRWTRFWSLFLLPWVHASGPVLGLGALLALGVAERSLSSDAFRFAGAGWTAGIASIAFLWNLPVHGNILLGGYGGYSHDRFFTPRNPLVGFVAVLGPVSLWNLPLCGLAVRAGRRGVPETLALCLPAATLLAISSNPEPERRLAPLIAVWTVCVFTRSIPGGRDERLLLAALALASGVFGLSSDFVDTVSTPIGVFSGPLLMFVRMAFVKGQPALAAAAVSVLAAIIVAAGSRTVAQLLRPIEAHLGETGSLAQNPRS